MTAGGVKERLTTAVDDTLAPTAALALLTIVSAVSMGRLFADGSYLGPVVMTAVACHALAWALRVRPVPALVVVAASVGSVVVLITWLVIPQTTAYGVPTGETFSTIWRELAQAREEFRRVVAPTPTILGFRLASVLGTAFVAFLADWAAFRMRSLFHAAVPSFALFVFSCFFAAERWQSVTVGAYLVALMLYLVLQQANLEATSTSWFASRSRGGTGGLLRVGGVLGCFVVAVALMGGPSLPGAGAKGVVDIGDGSARGPGNRMTTSPLLDIRSRMKAQSTVEVFTVTSDQRSYWRLTSLDQFDGLIWSSNNSYRPGGGELPQGFASSVPAVRASQHFVIGPLSSIWLPAAFEPVRVSGVDGASYHADSASLISSQDTAGGLEYRVVSNLPRPTAQQLRRSTGPPLAQDEMQRYTALPANLSPRIAVLARQIASRANPGTPYARALALQQFFRSPPFVYDLEVPAGHDTRALEDFLFERRRGYCEQYASAYAVLARAVGLSARVAVGYTPGDVGADGKYHVRGLNAHAWPEVHVPGAGWVPFEPTPGRGVPNAESYTFVPEQQARTEDPDTATTLPPQTTAPTTPPSRPAPETTEAPAEPDGGGRGLDDVAPRPVIWALLLIVATALVWGGGVPFAKRLRRDRRRTAAARPRDRVLVAWDETTEALALAGARRHLAETMPEYAGRAARAAALEDETSTRLYELAATAAAASYGASEPDPGAVARAVETAARIAADLQEAAGPRRRLRWALDPRRLLDGRSG